MDHIPRQLREQDIESAPQDQHTQNAQAMHLEYQEIRNKILLERCGIYGVEHLNELTEEQRDKRFNEKISNFRWFTLYESKRCIKAIAATTLSSVAALFFGSVGYFEYYDLLKTGHCDIEPQRTATIVVCSICGLATCCTACVYGIICCDACKSVRYGEKVTNEYEQILQLKQMGAKKNE
jgi:uncharacterized membrane protein YuzA (DUF378 family)